MRAVSVCLVALFGCGPLSPAFAQEGPPPSLLQQVVPNPTGKNGYERMVAAADMARSSPAWLALEGKLGATLTEKRAAMADARIARALATLRSAFDLPIASPRTGVTEATVFPELAAFRSLARLLVVRMYVSFAAGDAADALDWLRIGLLLGYHTQCESLISGLVGIAIDAMMVGTATNHVEQLSARDCERLLDICRKWIALPEPGERVLLRERDLMLGIIERARRDPATMADLFGAGSSEDAQPAGREALAAAAGDPARAARFLDTLASATRTYADQLRGQFRLPAWERRAPPIPAVSDPAAQQVLELSMSQQMGTRVLTRYAYEFAQVKVLAVHAAIRRYRWEHAKLPATLSDLELGDLVIDPQTGSEFRYRTTGPRTYELAAATPSTSG